MQEQGEKSRSGLAELSESSAWQPKGWLQWLLVIAVIFVFLHYLRSFIGWTIDQTTHSRWWLVLPPAHQHMFSGICMTGFGGVWIFYTLRYWERDGDLYRLFWAAILTTWGLYELFAAAMLS